MRRSQVHTKVWLAGTKSQSWTMRSIEKSMREVEDEEDDTMMTTMMMMTGMVIDTMIEEGIDREEEEYLKL